MIRSEIYQPTFGFAEKIDAETGNAVHNIEKLIIDKFGEVDFLEIKKGDDALTYARTDDRWWVTVKTVDLRGAEIVHSTGLDAVNQKPYISTYHPYRYQIFGDEAITGCYQALGKFGILSVPNSTFEQKAEDGLSTKLSPIG